jgi:hypothetical protein
MKVLFFDNNNKPFIIIRFSNADYKYQGFEMGEYNILKKKYKKSPGKLVQYLKINNFDYEKILLNI